MPNFANPARRTREQRLQRAAPFLQDDRMEAMAEMRDNRPEEFVKLPPAAVIALGLYESDRATHQALTGGDAA